MSIEQLEDLRSAAQGALDQIDDMQIELTVRYFVSRVRVAAHLHTLAEGCFDYAKIVHGHTCGELCVYFKEKLISVSEAYDANLRLLKLPALEQGLELDRCSVARQSLEWLAELTRTKIIATGMVRRWYLFPPFYQACSCRLEGYFDELQ